MQYAYNIQAEKKATNLSINSDLHKTAKPYNINLSKNFESHLNTLVKKLDEKKWQKENSKAIEYFNARVEKSGTFSDGLRNF